MNLVDSIIKGRVRIRAGIQNQHSNHFTIRQNEIRDLSAVACWLAARA